jgi:class 3 adenylate cyclase
VERKLVTIVFADLVGSTALADEQDPERTRALLDRFYDEMAAEIGAAGGTVEKFAGDAVMAAFGAPAAHEDDAERALHAALAMQRRLREFDDRLSLRIGVNTGEVVVDRPREGSSFVTGDAVNVAARLEQAAEPDEILVGERTVMATRGAFEFGDPTSIEAKGKGRPVECRRLMSPISLMRPRGVAGLGRAFVGRDDELAVLEQAYADAAASGGTRLVTVLGEAGVGKTRLVRELWDRLAERSPEPIRRVGRCLPYGDGITYWPLAEILKEHFGIFDDDPPEIVLERLAGQEILGLSLGLDVARDLHPLAVRDRFQDAWVEFLRSVAGDRPTAVLVEDAHWSEDPLLNLLERLGRDVEAPLLLIVTGRQELIDRRPGWGVAGTTVSLEALSADDSTRMLGDLLSDALPGGLEEVVVAHAEGNPFFVEELLATLIDRGLLQRSNGHWQLAELPSGFAVPDTVHAVLAARIDLLAPAEKAALQAAAVIGRIFWTGPVYELLGDAVPDLDVLEGRGFVRRRPSSSFAGEREYAITHALTREVAYASLAKGRRARLHAGVAAWLERTGGGRDEHAALLAHHLAEAVRPEDADLAWAGDGAELERLRKHAGLWLRRAARLAVGRYELDDGIALLERALDLEDDPAEQAAIWRAIGDANALKFDGEAFWTAMERSLETSDDPAFEADTYAELAFQTAIRSGMWTSRPDSALVGRWIDRALDLSGDEGPARAKALLARVFWDPSRRDAGEEAGELVEGLNDPELVSRAWQARTDAAFASADFETALSHSRHELEMVERISDPDHIADLYEHAIPPAIANGRVDEARAFSAKHAAIVEPLSAHHRLHGVAVRLEIEEAVGGWDYVLDAAPGTEAAVEANLATPCVRNARSLLVTALAAAYRGDDEAATRYEERACELIGGAESIVAAPRSRLALVRGRLDEAERLVPTPEDLRASYSWYALQEAAARLDVLGTLGDREHVQAEAPVLGVPGTYLEPFALRALALVEEDEALLERAIERFEAMNLAWHADETRKLKAET